MLVRVRQLIQTLIHILIQVQSLNLGSGPGWVLVQVGSRMGWVPLWILVCVWVQVLGFGLTWVPVGDWGWVLVQVWGWVPDQVLDFDPECIFL